MADTYICAMCHKEYEKARADAEAVAEMQQYFGDVPEEERAIVCGGCFQGIHPADHPVEVAEYNRAAEEARKK